MNAESEPKPSFRIVPYTEEHIPAVKRFNGRMEQSGASGSRFPETDVSNWIPNLPGRPLWQDYFVLLEEPGDEVRGAYIQKHQEFFSYGESVWINDYQLPISEGIADPAYRTCGVLLYLDACRRQPLQYGLGAGGLNTAVTRGVVAAGGAAELVPFYFQVRHPFSFCRKLTFLRTTFLRRLLLDVAAFTGLAQLVRIMQWSRRWRNRRGAPVAAQTVGGSVRHECVDEFGDGIDEVWRKSFKDYGLIACRDLATLKVLYPPEDPRFTRICVFRGDTIVGWVVVIASRLSSHKQFGNMMLGSIVDLLSLVGHEEDVIWAARMVLCEKNVDLIVSNLSHRRWCRAMDRCGFMTGPSNFASLRFRSLQKEFQRRELSLEDMHWTRGDGDGPINLS